MLEAVDRHGAIAINVDALLAQAGAVGTAAAHHGPSRSVLAEHAMAGIALAAAAAEVPWIVTGRGAAALATLAMQLGASGVALTSDAEARGMNALFAPDPGEIAAARAVLTEWERLRGRGRWLGVVDAAAGPRVVDRRTVRHARAVIARAEAVERREAARPV
jgi:citrate lyase beta subunit